MTGEFAAAIRKTGDVRFGVYYSLYEWYNELYQLDLDNGYTTQYHVEVCEFILFLSLFLRFLKTILTYQCT